MGGISVGTAIEIMKGTGVLKVIAGESVDNFFSVKKALFLEMVKKIDKTPPVRKRRLGLFYSLLDKDTAMKTLDKMQYDKTTRNRMMDVITGMAAVESITKPVNLKRFIADVDIERYRFLAEVAHDKNVIFCKSSERTTKRLSVSSIRPKIVSPNFSEALKKQCCPKTVFRVSYSVKTQSNNCANGIHVIRSL